MFSTAKKLEAVQLPERSAVIRLASDWFEPFTFRILRLPSRKTWLQLVSGCCPDSEILQLKQRTGPSATVTSVRNLANRFVDSTGVVSQVLGEQQVIKPGL